MLHIVFDYSDILVFQVKTGYYGKSYGVNRIKLNFKRYYGAVTFSHLVSDTKYRGSEVLIRDNKNHSQIFLFQHDFAMNMLTSPIDVTMSH